MTNKITDNAAMAAAIELLSETNAVFWHAKNNPHARQCLTNFNTDGQQTEAHTAVSLWAQP